MWFLCRGHGCHCATAPASSQRRGRQSDTRWCALITIIPLVHAKSRARRACSTNIGTALAGSAHDNRKAHLKIVVIGGTGYSIVHATQFFEFVTGVADQATDGNTIRLPGMTSACAMRAPRRPSPASLSSVPARAAANPRAAEAWAFPRTDLAFATARASPAARRLLRLRGRQHRLGTGNAALSPAENSTPHCCSVPPSTQSRRLDRPEPSPLDDSAFVKWEVFRSGRRAVYRSWSRMRLVSFSAIRSVRRWPNRSGPSSCSSSVSI